MAARYRLRTFGGVSLEGPAGPLSGAATQHRRLALLALVAAAGERGVSRDRLIGLLWPESEPAKARQVLTQWLHLIRRDLGEDSLFLGTQELRLNPEHITSDVGELGAALDRADVERAAALYTGPFLDGFYLSGAPEFERWVEEERARLAGRMRSAFQAIARESADRGDWAAAATWGERLAALDPLDAAIALAYMRALEKSGAGAKAIQHARIYAAMVRQELDAEPDPAVARLAESFRASGERAAAADEARVARRAAEPPPPAPVMDAPASATAPAAPAAPAAVPPPVPRARTFIRLGYVAGLATVALFALLAAPSARAKPEASRVMIAAFVNETGDTTLDPLGRMAADWITRGVGETGVMQIATGVAQASKRDPAPTAAASAAGAGTLITGRFYRQGDSLAFTAMVADVESDRVLRAIGPVLASRERPLDGIEQLRRRVMGSIAAIVDSGFAPLAVVVAEPPSYEAFRAMSAGALAGSVRRHQEAIEHFRRAAALDTSYLYPLVRMANAYGNMFDCFHVDSIGAVLAPRRERLSPYETYALDRELQHCQGDLNAAYRSTKRLYALAPRARATRQYLARTASALNRQREVVEVLLPSALDSTQSPSPLFTYVVLGFALHGLGDYRRELEVARRARALYPENVEPLAAEARVHAALGDLDGVRRAVAAGMALHREQRWTVQGWVVADILMTATDELRAHGRVAESRAMGVQFADWLREHPPARGNRSPGDRVDREYLHALYVALAGAERWDEARAVGDTLALRHGTHISTLAVLGRLAAYRGDARTAERFADSLAGVRGPYLRGQHTHARAQIAAILGQREKAVRLLRDAMAQGVEVNTYRPMRLGSVNHALPEFQSLRGYGPFEDLLRPRD